MTYYPTKRLPANPNNMVKSVVNGVITYYPGRHYQKIVEGTDVTEKKHYSAAGQTFAMRTILNGITDVLNWLLGDHLGSTSITAEEDGDLLSQIKYTAFGEIREETGTTPTDYLYTNQLRQVEIGLYYYVARWYDPVIAHFTQPDTVIPNAGDAGGFDRYRYAKNNPIMFNDPSGHLDNCGLNNPSCYNGKKDVQDEMINGTKFDDALLARIGEENASTFSQKYSGEDMKWLYEQYANQTNSWWYELWGNDADGFTAVDFLKLIIYFEMSGKADGDSVGLAGYAYAISEKMSMICAAQSSSGSCGGLSDNAIFNYLTSRASAWVRYDGLYWYGKSLDPSSTNKSADVNARGATVWANFVVDSALAQLHPQGSNADWGNVLTLGKVTDVQGLANAPIGIKELYSPSGEGPYIYWRYGTEGDFLYLGSAEQLRHWER